MAMRKFAYIASITYPFGKTFTPAGIIACAKQRMAGVPALAGNSADHDHGYMVPGRDSNRVAPSARHSQAAQEP